LCRYDFFPSLMCRASVSDVHSGVVWASFKKRRHRLQNVWWQRWYRLFYGTFDWVIPATREDQKLFEALGGVRVLESCEMRVPQIVHRLEKAQDHLRDHFPHWEKFKAHLYSYPHCDRWIMGSFWPEDLALIKNKKLQQDVLDSKLVMVMVPHSLSPQWPERLAQIFPHVFVIDDKWDGVLPEKPALIILNLKGVLCELYQEFGRAYVGGGYGRSVHSVLEPFVAGARIVCGPKVHRSTEVEAILAVAPMAIDILVDLNSLESYYSEQMDISLDLTLRREWLDNQIKLLKTNLHQVLHPC
jgi:3-deoxy-D-manno-octulosonic-acid transferase